MRKLSYILAGLVLIGAFIASGKLETQRLQVSGDSVQAFDQTMDLIHHNGN